MLKDLLKACRSYRGFDEARKVSKEELMEMVDCVRYVGASCNTQPLKYYLAWEADKVEEILAETKWAASLPELDLPYEGQHPTAFIIICQDLAITTNETLYLKDVGIAGQIINMAACEMGLGGCMIGNFSPKKMSQVLELPETLVPKLVVAIGKPAEKIVLTEVAENGKIAYYRDEEGTHYVPKRSLKEILI